MTKEQQVLVQTTVTSLYEVWSETNTASDNLGFVGAYVVTKQYRRASLLLIDVCSSLLRIADKVEELGRTIDGLQELPTDAQG